MPFSKAVATPVATCCTSRATPAPRTGHRWGARRRVGRFRRDRGAISSGALVQAVQEVRRVVTALPSMHTGPAYKCATVVPGGAAGAPPAPKSPPSRAAAGGSRVAPEAHSTGQNQHREHPTGQNEHRVMHASRSRHRSSGRMAHGRCHEDGRERDHQQARHRDTFFFSSRSRSSDSALLTLLDQGPIAAPASTCECAEGGEFKCCTRSQSFS